MHLGALVRSSVLWRALGRSGGLSCSLCHFRARDNYVKKVPHAERGSADMITEGSSREEIKLKMVWTCIKKDTTMISKIRNYEN